MNCIELDNDFAAYNAVLHEEKKYLISKLDERVGNCAHFLQQTKNQQPTIRLVSNKSRDSINERSTSTPHSKEEIDRTRQASRETKEEANQHTRDSWRALGNHEWGDCIIESIDGVRSLRESEKLEKEAVRMENENIDYYQNVGK